MRVCDNNVVHIYNETDTSLGGMMIEQKMINIIFIIPNCWMEK